MTLDEEENSVPEKRAKGVISLEQAWEKVCSIIEEPCGKWQEQATARKLDDCVGSWRAERVEKASLAREHICLMSRGMSAQDEGRFAAALLAAVIGDDVGSRFFWELVDKALAEAAAMQFAAMDGTGAFCSYIRCGSENVSQVMDIVRGVFKSVAADGVSEDELRKAKNKILSALVIKNELSMGRLVDLGFNWTYLEEYRTIEDDIEAIKAVTVGEVHAVIEQFSPGEFTQFSIGPEKAS